MLSPAQRFWSQHAPRKPVSAAMIAALMLIYVIGYAYVSAIPDTNRDMFLAQRIASGASFPLQGPILGGALHLGPLWYYLLAIPMALTSSWLVTTLFVGCLASLKFPLAYLCGRRLVDERFGLLWALLLALPGWHDFERLTVFNPNPAAAATLGLAYTAIRISGSAAPVGALLGCGLLFGIAVHIHPTVAIAGVFPLAAIYSNKPAAQVYATRLRQLALFGLGASIPCLPYVISQFALGFPDAASANAYVGQSIAWSNWSKLPLMLWSIAAVGPYLALLYIAQITGPALVAACALLAVLYAASVAGLLRIARSSFAAGRIRLLALLAGILIGFVWVLVLRDNTPVYFVYWLSPMCAALLALGLRELPGLKLITTLVFTLVLALSARSGWMIAATMNTGVGALPNSQEIKRLELGAPYVDIWLPAYAHDSLGAFLCSLPPGATLHGPLAHTADWNTDTDARLACGRASHAKLGGTDGNLQLLGMPLLFWERIETAPDCTIGPIGIARNPRVLSSKSTEIADGSRYLPRDFNRTAAQPTKLRFKLSASEALLITNYLFPYVLAEIRSVTANGMAAEPVAITEMARLYAAPNGRADVVTWDVEIALPPSEGLDFVAVPSNRKFGEQVSACR